MNGGGYMNQAIQIALKNGKLVVWEEDEWDDYSYEEKHFIVKKNNARIGIYNLDEVAAIIVP